VTVLPWRSAARTVLGGSVGWHSKVPPRPEVVETPSAVPVLPPPPPAHVARAPAEVAVPPKKPRRPCVVCGKQISGPGNRRYCSDACRLRPGAPVSKKPSPPAEVLREAGRCTICGDSIDRRLPAFLKHCQDCLEPRDTLRLAADRLDPDRLVGWIRYALGLNAMGAGGQSPSNIEHRAYDNSRA
jgi:hypothetical protein